MQTIGIHNPSLLTSQSLANSFLSQLESKTNQPLRIVAIGDSIVYGYGDFVGGGWVERLRRQWMSPGQKDRVLYNLGVRGDRVCDVHRRLETEFSTRGELRNRVPDVILLSVGTNDSPSLGKPEGRLFTEFSDFQQQIADLLDLGSSLAPVLGNLLRFINELSNATVAIDSIDYRLSISSPSTPVIPDYDDSYIDSFERYLVYYAFILQATLGVRNEYVDIKTLDENTTGAILKLKFKFPFDYSKWLLGSNYVGTVERIVTDNYNDTRKDLFIINSSQADTNNYINILDNYNLLDNNILLTN